MSETNVQNVDQNALVDLFPDLGAPTVGGDTKPKFGMQEGNVDLFAPPTPAASTKEETTKPVEGAAAEPLKPEEKQPLETTKDTDILGATGDVKPTPTPLSDLSTYYQDRIKSGKFVAIEDSDEKGNPIPFIPKTAEEYDEVLELQINYRLDQAKKDLQEKWYASKSPAWKVVGQFAELVDDPSQLIPFIQGVKTIQSVSNLNENEIDGAEQIVRTRLAQKGDPEEVIAQQVDALKTTDKLLATAKSYKPLMLQQEQINLKNMEKQKLQEEQQYHQLVSEIRESALKSIEAPLFGKTKLKQEEKAAIYDLIGEPAEETQGYGIYTVIDQLFDKRDFETLKEIALLLAKKDAFYGYLGTNVANQTAASLERKLRLAGESRSTSGNDFHEENRQPSVSRNQFKSKPTFGR
jgi:hypothetical protein